MVDFNKLLRNKLGPEAYAKFERDREYLAAEHRRYAEMTTDDLVKSALHTWHNSGCTSRGQNVNGYGPSDCVYDAALISELEAGRAAKCPVAGCTGYVELL